MTGTARHISAAQFNLTSADVVAAHGASWDGTTLTLADQSFAYIVFAVASPAEYAMLHLGCFDNGSRAWVGISDRTSDSWRWLGHYESEMNGVRARAGGFADDNGAILFAIVAAGETFSSPVIFGSTTATLLPPDDWPAKFTVPPELGERYSEMLVAFDSGDSILEWTEQTDFAGRRAACYYQMQSGQSVRDEVIAGSFEGDDPAVDVAFHEFEGLADAEITMLVHFSGSTIANFDLRRPVTKSERAWYADQVLLHYPDLIQWVEPNGIGGPPP